MPRRIKAILLVGIVSNVLTTYGTALADDWVTSVDGPTHDAASINAKLADGTGTGTITIDDASTILVDTEDIINCTGIIVEDADAAIIFSVGRKIVFANANGEITFTDPGALAIDGAFSDAGFDYATTASGKTLTITSANSGTLDSTAVSNQILLGNGNTLKIVAGGSPALSSVMISGFATLDIDESCTITTTNMAADTTIRVAPTKMLTTTVTVNNNKLTLYEANGGTITTVNLNADGGVIDVIENTMIDACDLAGNATIDVAADKTLTVTNGVDTNAKTLSLTGPGTINQVDIDGAGGILNVMESCTVTTVNVEADGAINVVENKTLTGTVNIKNKTLALNHKGKITTGVFAADGGILNVNETCEVTTINMNANGSVNVASGKTLTTNLNVGSRTLRLLGAGTITKIIATTGKVQADGTPQITTLQPGPGAGGTFTFDGTGSATVTTLTPLDTTGEIFTKTGTGSLVVTNGFSFAGATGIKLNINEGAFNDPSGQNIVFGDDAEKITVAGGATYTTAGNITGHSGTSTNFESAPTSTVNFNKNGLLMLTATADNDFVLLGTVNIMDDCIVQMAGFYQSRFGHINIKNQGSLVNNIANSTLLFAPNSIITLEGFGSGTLNINGQTAATAITMSTIGDTGQFTINRGASNNMTVRYAALSNCVYLSNQGGYADAELGNKLVGLVDDGNNVNWWSPLIADAGADKTIISGNSTMLEGSAVGAKPPYTYAWTPATGLNDPTLATPRASPTVTTEYTLTVTDSVGTSDVDVMTVTVTPALAVDAGPDQEIGRGESATLQGSATGGSGQFAYAWSPTTGLDNANIATPTASPEQTTTYTLTVTDLGDQGKTASDTATITVKGIFACGSGICGMGGVGLLPLTLLGLMGCKWSWRRKTRMHS
ncbi:MAG: hypothetical protein GXY44_07550 [Phycisphaerales bacterium]|nr:hypothetical protein [Phycisphaerales bacterium]